VSGLDRRVVHALLPLHSALDRSRSASRIVISSEAFPSLSLSIRQTKSDWAEYSCWRAWRPGIDLGHLLRVMIRFSVRGSKLEARASRLLSGIVTSVFVSPKPGGIWPDGSDLKPGTCRRWSGQRLQLLPVLADAEMVRSGRSGGCTGPDLFGQSRVSKLLTASVGPYPPGFGLTNTLVTMPLSRRLALASSFEPLTEKRIINTQQVAEINSRTRHARQPTVLRPVGLRLANGER